MGGGRHEVNYMTFRFAPRHRQGAPQGRKPRPINDMSSVGGCKGGLVAGAFICEPVAMLVLFVEGLLPCWAH
jgi:hypothetical protein